MNKKVEKILLSSVAPQYNEIIFDYFKESKTIIFDNSKFLDFIDLNNVDFKKMGADRVIVDIAAINEYGKNVRRRLRSRTEKLKSDSRKVRLLTL